MLAVGVLFEVLCGELYACVSASGWEEGESFVDGTGGGGGGELDDFCGEGAEGEGDTDLREGSCWVLMDTRGEGYLEGWKVNLAQTLSS